MREILFKAKRLDNGEWVYGYLVKRENLEEYYIVEDMYEQITYGQRYLRSDFRNECYRVDPETVCQSTGWTDNNGKEVFENDILRIYDKLMGEIKFAVRFGNCGGIKNTDRLVGYHGFFFEGYDEEAKKYINIGLRDDPVFWITGSFCEVIGNIHDRETSDTHIPSNSEGREKLGNLRNAF